MSHHRTCCCTPETLPCPPSDGPRCEQECDTSYAIEISGQVWRCTLATTTCGQTFGVGDLWALPTVQKIVPLIDETFIRCRYGDGAGFPCDFAFQASCASSIEGYIVTTTWRFIPQGFNLTLVRASYETGGRDGICMPTGGTTHTTSVPNAWFVLEDPGTLVIS